MRNPGFGRPGREPGQRIDPHAGDQRNGRGLEQAPLGEPGAAHQQIDRHQKRGEHGGDQAAPDEFRFVGAGARPRRFVMMRVPHAGRVVMPAIGFGCSALDRARVAAGAIEQRRPQRDDHGDHAGDDEKAREVEPQQRTPECRDGADLHGEQPEAQRRQDDQPVQHQIADVERYRGPRVGGEQPRSGRQVIAVGAQPRDLGRLFVRIRAEADERLPDFRKAGARDVRR